MAARIYLRPIPRKTRGAFKYKQPDGRYAIYLDDVLGAKITAVKTMRGKGNESVIRLNGSKDVVVDDTVYHDSAWDHTPEALPRIHYASGSNAASFPDKKRQ